MKNMSPIKDFLSASAFAWFWLWRWLWSLSQTPQLGAELVYFVLVLFE
jgi:hypothetical protein